LRTLGLGGITSASEEAGEKSLFVARRIRLLRRLPFFCLPCRNSPGRRVELVESRAPAALGSGSSRPVLRGGELGGVGFGEERGLRLKKSQKSLKLVELRTPAALGSGSSRPVLRGGELGGVGFGEERGLRLKRSQKSLKIL
jgi:hypothetical protein